MPVTFNDKVISGTVTAAQITYDKDIPHRHGFAIQAKWSGAAISGYVKVQGSVNGEDFLDIEDSRVDFTAAGAELWSISAFEFREIRIVCESTAGAVTFEVWLILKKDAQIS